MKLNVTKTLKKVLKVGTAGCRYHAQDQEQYQTADHTGNAFENMGLTYLGPVDGHNMRQMMKL